MLTIEGGALMGANTVFAMINGFLRDVLPRLDQDGPIPTSVSDPIRREAAELLVLLTPLNAPLTILAVERLIDSLKRVVQYRELNNLIEQILPRLKDELGLMHLLALDPAESKLYAPVTPHFGAEVRAKFSHAIYDIDEAGKCLALGRSTASVFHLMHVLEMALQAIHACLGLPIPDNASWGIWLKGIRDERQKRGLTNWSESVFFQDVCQHLDSIKEVHRDPTLHVDTIHTAEEALLIFENAKTFMKKIASRMDEKGEPKA